MTLNLFDIIVSIIFIASFILATYRGFILTFLDIIKFLSTIILTIFLFPLSKDIVNEYTSNPLMLTIISSIIAYILSKIICNFIAKKLSEVIKPHTGNLIDRLLGSFIGAIKGFCLCCLLFIGIIIISSSSYLGAKNAWLIFANINPSDHPRWLKSSKSFVLFNKSYEHIFNFMEGGWVESKLESVILMDEKAADNSSDSEKDFILDNAEKIQRFYKNNFTPNKDSERDTNNNDNLTQEIKELLGNKSS